MDSNGWKRRPELDTLTKRAWQRPDGTIWLHPKGAPDPLFISTIKKRKVLPNE